MAPSDLHDVPPTLAARGVPRPESRPGDDGPGAPARRRRLGPLGLSLVLVLAGTSLALMIAPAGMLVVGIGIALGAWSLLAGATDGPGGRTRRR
ncbi:MAG: hypothetical protein KIT14_06510 [bacterium]|nr:hypothetical protein [bacterium]